MTKNFLRPDEVAEILRVTVRTVYRYIGDGLLLAVRIGGVNRIRQEDFEKFVEGEKEK